MEAGEEEGEQVGLQRLLFLFLFLLPLGLPFPSLHRLVGMALEEEEEGEGS